MYRSYIEQVSYLSDFEFAKSGNSKWTELISKWFSTEGQFAVTTVTKSVQLSFIYNITQTMVTYVCHDKERKNLKVYTITLTMWS